MIKEGSKVLVHIFSCFCNEVITDNYGKVFEVKTNEAGELGIDWNTRRSPFTCKGELFTPFHTFADNVIFEDYETGKNYHFSNIMWDIVENTTEEI